MVSPAKTIWEYQKFCQLFGDKVFGLKESKAEENRGWYLMQSKEKNLGSGHNDFKIPNTVHCIWIEDYDPYGPDNYLLSRSGKISCRLNRIAYCYLGSPTG